MADRFSPLPSPDSAIDMDISGGLDDVPSSSHHRRSPGAPQGVQCCGSRLTERRCMMTLIILMIGLVVLAFGLFISERIKSRDGLTPHPGTCQSKTCIQLSSQLISSMNQSADPCQDFYEYACGGWNAANPIPDDKARWSTFNLLSENNLRYIRSVLDDSSIPSNKATLYYQSCMNEAAINQAGATPIQATLASINWSPSDDNNWSTSDYESLTNAISTLHWLQVFPLYSMLVYADDMNSNINVGHLTQSGLGLPDRAYYIGKDKTTDSTLVAYQTYLRSLFSNAGLTLSEARLQDLLAFETSLATVNIPKADLRDPNATYNKMTVSDLPTLNSNIKWSKYFGAMFPNMTEEARLAITVIVATPRYFGNLSTIIAQTNKQVVVNYLQSQFLLGSANHLSSPFVDATFAFNKAVYGLQVQSPRWRTCIARTDSALGFILGKMFVDAKFPVEARAAATKMIANIKTAFKTGLPSLSWMDDATRTAASSKADAVVYKIGYPDWIQNSTELAKYYSKLTIGTTSYWDNSINIRRYEIDENMSDLKIKVDKSRWDMTPATVNAYYNPSNNEIVFPAGIMQSPFFDKGFPTSVNYGAIGVVVGHELTHGFDDQGSQYDAAGNLRPWWSDTVTTAFKQVTKCISDQYSNYTVNGDHVQGELTLGENIADNGGLKESYSAYKTWSSANGAEQTLPGLGLNHDQLFFLAFAQPWCGAARPGEAKRLILTDPHAPAKYRVIGTLSNSNDFAAAYHCASGTPMNPIKKCSVW